MYVLGRQRHSVQHASLHQSPTLCAVPEIGLAMAMESSTGTSTNKTQLFKHYYLLWSHAKLIRQWDFSNGRKVTALPWSPNDCLKKL